MMTKKENKLGASFRDPSGFMFRREDQLYRQVNRLYQGEYDRLMASGLYEKLTKDGLLISHQEVDLTPEAPELAYKVLSPDLVPFISYPYEWSFSQLKDAALATLRIEKRALAKGMSLKDASAYNIQFIHGRPVLIDTLSFETYQEGKPWLAYRQFCQHFLAPLALMAYCDVRLSQLLKVYIDGVPLDLASRLLPLRTRLNFSLVTHLHLHSAAQQRYSDKTVSKAAVSGRVSKTALLALIESLRSTIHKLTWKPAGTEWVEYYQDTNYSKTALEHKKELVKTYLARIEPSGMWDLGANTGLFSRLASDAGIPTVAFDVDPAAVERTYLDIVAERKTERKTELESGSGSTIAEDKKKRNKSLLPLVMDLTNPSPSIGWQNRERESFIDRGPADAVLALALIHHLALSNNVPLASLAEFLRSITHWLIIEFVPKTDSQVQRLLTTRADIFPDYNEQGFEDAFASCFTILDATSIQDSQRRLYLMEAL
jgi:ribosomal protein L11 methylase PrmA